MGCARNAAQVPGPGNGAAPVARGRLAAETGRSANCAPQGRRPSRLRAKSAHQEYDEADEQDEAEPATADGGTAEVETAAAEQEKKHYYEKDEVHGSKITRRDWRAYGVFPPEAVQARPPGNGAAAGARGPR